MLNECNSDGAVLIIHPTDTPAPLLHPVIPTRDLWNKRFVPHRSHFNRLSLSQSARILTNYTSPLPPRQI